MDLQSSNVVNGAMYKMGPCGSASDSPTDMDMNGVTRIIKVEINCNTAINSLSIQFERNGQEVWTPSWGSTDAGVVYAINLAQNEYFTKVTGYVGTYQGQFVVRSLTFFTNTGTYGPFGGEDQDCALFQLPAAGGKIVGFHGRAGLYLDAFGTYVEMPSI